MIENKKDKKSTITIPKYTLAEELINSISHGIGVLFAITALVLCVVFSSINNNVPGIVACSIYGSSLIIMFLISTLYHSFSPKLKAKKIFRLLDHLDIYILIAGTYTPYCLCVLKGVIGWVVFGIVWLLALIGIIINCISFEKFKKLSLILYVLMGWVIIFSFNTLKNNLDINGLLLLLSGGIIYTIGAILYAIGKKKKYFHSIFHIFVFIASFLMFLSIILYVV